MPGEMNAQSPDVTATLKNLVSEWVKIQDGLKELRRFGIQKGQLIGLKVGELPPEVGCPLGHFGGLSANPAQQEVDSIVLRWRKRLHTKLQATFTFFNLYGRLQQFENTRLVQAWNDPRVRATYSLETCCSDIDELLSLLRHNLKPLGQRVQERMSACDHKLEFLAERLGCDPATLSKIRRCKQVPRSKLAEKLEQYVAGTLGGIDTPL